MKSRLLILVVSFLATLVGCGDSDSEGNSDAAGGIGPVSVPTPTPDPVPEPDPSPGWVLQDSGAVSPVTAISAIDSNHAWTGEDTLSNPNEDEVIEGGLRRTEDGGAAWDFLGPVPENQDQVIFYSPSVLEMQFFDQQHGFVLTRYSLLSTSDGGQTWVTRLNSLETAYGAMSFVSPTT